MKGLVGLAVLTALTLPAAASNPTQTKKVKPRPTQSAEPPLALPIPANPPPAPERALGGRLLEAALCPDRALARFVTDQVNRYRMSLLLNESDNFEQPRTAFRRFWMNNQPSVLTYERLNWATGP